MIYRLVFYQIVDSKAKDNRKQRLCFASRYLGIYLFKYECKLLQDKHVHSTISASLNSPMMKELVISIKRTCACISRLQPHSALDHLRFQNSDTLWTNRFLLLVLSMLYFPFSRNLPATADQIRQHCAIMSISTK